MTVILQMTTVGTSGPHTLFAKRAKHLTDAEDQCRDDDSKPKRVRTHGMYYDTVHQSFARQ